MPEQTPPSTSASEPRASWESVADCAHRIWSLANDGFEFGDEQHIKGHAAAILAAAERNGVDVVGRLQGRVDG